MFMSDMHCGINIDIVTVSMLVSMIVSRNYMCNIKRFLISNSIYIYICYIILIFLQIIIIHIMYYLYIIFFEY